MSNTCSSLGDGLFVWFRCFSLSSEPNPWWPPFRISKDFFFNWLSLIPWNALFYFSSQANSVCASPIQCSAVSAVAKWSLSLAGNSSSSEVWIDGCFFACFFYFFEKGLIIYLWLASTIQQTSCLRHLNAGITGCTNMPSLHRCLWSQDSPTLARMPLCCPSKFRLRLYTRFYFSIFILNRTVNGIGACLV